MNFIKCPHCGHEDPSFDYAHVCLTGPYALKYEYNWTEISRMPVTPEEEEAWKEVEKKKKWLEDAAAQEIANHIDSLALAKKTSND